MCASSNNMTDVSNSASKGDLMSRMDDINNDIDNIINGEKPNTANTSTI